MIVWFMRRMKMIKLTDTIRGLILLFSIMFFWVLSVDAFAQATRCFDDGKGIVRCVKPDGTMTTIIRS